MSFTVFLQVNANGTKDVSIEVQNSTTVADLIQKYKDKEGDDSNFSFKFRGKPLSDQNKSLRSYRIRNGSRILVTFKMAGGSQDEGNDGPSPRQFKKSEAQDMNVTITKDYCEIQGYCFNGSGTKNTYDRAKVKPCLHVYCSDCAHGKLKSCVEYNRKTEVKCAITGCNKVLDIDEVMVVAALNDEEMKSYECKLNEYSIEYECPNKQCRASLDGSGIKENKVQCVRCKGDWFCKVCKKKWPEKPEFNINDCGNEDCDSGPRLYELLLNCDKKSEGPDINVPVLRLCISCRQQNDWETNCKHITCTKCTTKYCHVCLKPGHGCSNYSKCEIAPTQTV